MSRATATWPGSRLGGFLPIEAATSAIVVFAIGVLTLAALVFGNGNVWVAIAPIAGVITLWAIAKSPVRNTLFVLFFLGLALDRPGDADTRWESWFSSVGGLIVYNVSETIPNVPIKLSGLWLILILLLLIRTHRSLTGRIVDVPGAVPMAPPMRLAVAVSSLTVVWLIILGAITGGDIQMAKVQVQVILALLLLAYLLAPSLRVPTDYRTLGTIVVTAACCKALLALWIRHLFPGETVGRFGIGELDFATSHGDSLLFTSAIMMLLVTLAFQPTKRHFAAFVGLGTLIFAGMVANDRRVGWAELGLGFILFLALNPRNWITRKLVRATVLALPVILVYVAVGWNVQSRVFRPVQTIRSMVEPQRLDGSIDRSTLFRDVENYNLIYTFQQNPVVGRGFGHGFDSPVPNDLRGFKEYAYLPHNSVLGLMGFAGGLGVLGLLAPIVVALFLAARTHGMTKTPEISMAAMVVIANLGAYLVHMWGDIGFTEPTSIFTVGPSLAVASQVAVSTGAWRVAPIGLAQLQLGTEGR